MLKALREVAHEMESQLWDADMHDQHRRIADDAWSLDDATPRQPARDPLESTSKIPPLTGRTGG